MNKYINLIIITICTINMLNAQSIKVQPYLQDASPNSIFILWETTSGEESIVEWGLTDMLGNTSIGNSETTSGDARLHEVKLENLKRFTKYFYRIKTNTAISEIYNFKTPPFASDHEPFRIIAMSDMQRDNSFPNKYQEIINDGIIDYLDDEFGGEIIDNLALVIIPGDLVQNGNNFSSWEQHFFTPSQALYNQVPVYPVPGNHEQNSAYFFQYFKLPTNGSTGFEEHWWHKDYGNVRIIGLDSNNPFNNQEQLDWLQLLLDATCVSDSIDFVFAQLHHPHKSELWTPGESNYTGKVVNLLEQFTNDCGKPSIHFYGHTHGYSRGNSRDDKHLWINVATAGGAIDNWGEFPNFDYDEFSVTQDDYGFVSLEITDDADPKVVIKRISRGDQDIIIDNELTDSFVLRLNPSPVNIPSVFSPVNEIVIPECVTLKAGEFSSPNLSALHGQSHWQVSMDTNDFTIPIFDSWNNFENWYFEIDTQADDDLTDEQVLGLKENTAYWWRVRYRDRELNWSEWSTPSSFTTGKSIASPNLLLNHGAEDSLSQWTVVEGVVEALTSGICDGIAPHSGNRYFAVGGLCTESAVGRCIQNVDVSSFSDSIDAGTFYTNFGGYLSNFGGQDLPEMRIIFLDKDSSELGTSPTISSLNNSWTMLNERATIPEQTRTIQIELKGTLNAGTDNDSYFDDLFLKVGANDFDCNLTTAINNPSVPYIQNYQVTPNPITSSSYISISNIDFTNVSLFIVDANGTKINSSIKYESERIVIEKGNLAKGTYFIWLRKKGVVIGKGKFIVI